MERMARRPVFDGPVEAGRDYILIDDHETMGGTLNELRKLIENNGGHVKFITTLTASQFSSKIAITPDTVNALYEKFGDELDDELREAGIAGDAASLTESEGRKLLSKAISVDTLRSFRTEERFPGIRSTNVGENASESKESKLNRSDNQDGFSDGERRFSAEEDNGQQEYNPITIDDVKNACKGAEVKEVLPNVFRATFKNGNRVYIHAQDRVILTADEEMQARRDHKIPDGVPVFVNGAQQGNAIDLSNYGDKNTIYHELEHWAERFMTPAQLKALKDYFGDAESRAEAAKKYHENPRQYNGGIGKVLKIIDDVVNAALRLFGNKRARAEHVLSQLESGEIYNQQKNSLDNASDTKYDVKKDADYVKLDANEKREVFGNERPTGYRHAAFNGLNNMLSAMPLSSKDDLETLYTRLLAEEIRQIKNSLTLMRVAQDSGNLEAFNVARETAIDYQMSSEAKKEVFTNATYLRGLARFIKRRSDTAGKKLVGGPSVFVNEYLGKRKERDGGNLPTRVAINVNDEYKIPNSDAFRNIQQEVLRRLRVTEEEERNGHGIRYTGVFEDVTQANKPKFIDAPTKFSISAANQSTHGNNKYQGAFSITQKIANLFRGKSKDTGINRKMLRQQLEDLTGLKIRWGKLEGDEAAALKDAGNIIRAKNAYDLQLNLALLPIIYTYRK